MTAKILESSISSSSSSLGVDPREGLLRQVKESTNLDADVHESTIKSVSRQVQTIEKQNGMDILEDTKEKDQISRNNAGTLEDNAQSRIVAQVVDHEHTRIHILSNLGE